MKKILLLLLFTIGLNGQKNVFGENIENDKIMSNKQLILLYDEDSKFNTKFEATVFDVCQMKGCWMRLDLGDNKKVLVNFKDYGFFVPKDISGKNVVVSGVAFKKIIPIDELKHYASDRGDSDEKIASINKPEIVYSLIANGVKVLSN
ncbi:MAG: DUF4920 domain-containing protein [Flavobacteriaceae bacterium]|nr:DUF4920 domain-containing protein [Flavobacteriaceae bacterium]|tara:strand:- start:1062 stop:1505 length:444 start_codon:yes stop_codon:yes gene_type:complete